ncbi:MAG: hypothetical protein AABZ47_17760 [Planctomycetota bacterium]
MRNHKRWNVVPVMTVLMSCCAATVWADGKSSRQSDVQRPEKAQTFSIQAASESPMAGYQLMMAEGGRVVYVSSKGLLGSTGVGSVSLDQNEGTLTLTASGLVSEGISNGLVAVMVDGRVIALPTSSVSSQGITLSGFQQGEAQRLSRIMVAVPTAPAGTQLTLVARDSIVRAGDAATIDVFISGFTDLRAYQIALDAVGDEAGRLSLEDMMVDSSRPDYVFAGLQAVDAADKSKARLLSALFSGGVSASQPRYLGTYTFKVPTNSAGVITANVRINQDTLLRDSTGGPIAYTVASPARLSVGLESSTPTRR